MVSYPPNNLIDSIVDEVALEGLDGITIPALWLRLAQRFHISMPLPEELMRQIWLISIKVNDFTFYELPSPRDPLVLFDRYEFVDPDLGIILEPDNMPEDIYPHFPIDDHVAKLRGSCSTYYSRKDISTSIKNCSLEHVVDEYDQKLVIVASQYVREQALMGNEVCPSLKLNSLQYCFLERVGRSRYHGEVTQGKLSLSVLHEDPKCLFYHRKFLLRYKLITKQMHHQKNSGYSSVGSLLHLPRFYVERRSKVIYLAEQVIEILKSKENYVADYDEIKKKLQIVNSIKKLFKTSFFQKVVKTDLRVPYRTLYPNAKPKEWQQKNYNSKEKMIRVVQLLTPDIDIADIWNKDEVQEAGKSYDIDISNHKLFIPYLKQANNAIEGSYCEGTSQGILSKDMGLTKLQCRTVLRSMVKTNIVATYMNDIGRQRVTNYVSKKFEKNSTMSKQFQKEVFKIKELTKKITTENDETMKLKIQEKENIDSITEENTNVKEKNELSSTKSTDETDVSNNRKSSVINSNLNNLFYIVNRILFKYRLSKSKNKYKGTSLNGRIKLIYHKCVDTCKSTKESISETKNNDTSNSNAFKALSNNSKAVSIYNSIKTNLVAQKLISAEKIISENFGFMEDVGNNEKRHVSTVTYRLLRRANMIIESVKEHQVIDDMTKLMKMINEEEDKEGYDVKIDRKSLIRLLQKLAKGNLIKNIRLTLTANDREKNLTFICDPNIDINHTVIKSAVEQAKVKFCLLGSQRDKSKNYTHKVDVDKVDADTLENMNKDEEKSTKQQATVPPTFKYDPKVGREHGYSPKFVRMQAVHLLLYYLVYDHPGEQTLSKEEQIQMLHSRGFNIDSSLSQEMSTIYNMEVGWKMFVPSLLKHNGKKSYADVLSIRVLYRHLFTGWPQGWTLMCDVLLRIPLSIFLKVHSVPFIIPGLEYYTSHPIRKHYLVKNLPTNIRNTLLFARKYIFNVHETVTRLCYIGLVQFGPQKLKEKDQVFIYINRHTELMDTISSAPGYHKIEDKVYPVTKYTFDKMYVVDKYWYDMWNTCINTPLGGRLVVQGKDILLEDLSKKNDMLQAILARTATEAIKLDTGKVPGDRKGAAGIDSAFFAHLKRNWSWKSNYQQSEKTQVKNNAILTRNTYLSKIEAKPVKFTEFSGLKKVSGPNTVNATELKRKMHSPSTKINESSGKPKKHVVLTSLGNSRQKSFIRRVMPRKTKVKSRVKYDEIDYRALQRMHKLRVDWEPHEDNILLVCKVVMMYLCPNPRKQVVTFNMVRDLLRTYSFSSYNKTSRACQRRLLYMLKQPQTVNSVSLGVQEIKLNFFITKRFGDIIERIKEECTNSNEYEKRVADVFKNLVAYVAKKYYNISEIGLKEPIIVPKTIQEFNIFYKIVYPAKQFNPGFIKDVKNINDVHSAMINSVIHSSMCCVKDRRSWAYQLFKIYQQYPEILLRNAMAKIRADQMVTMKKNHLHAMQKYGNCMPMSSSQYQLSTNYIYKFHTKWPYSIYSESYDAFFKLIEWYSKCHTDNDHTDSSALNGTELLPVTGGIVATIHDFMSQDRLDFDIEIPDQVIMLDPRLKEKDETYFRIAQRYKDILAGLDYFKDHLETNENSKFEKDTKDIEKEMDGFAIEDNHFEHAKDEVDYDDSSNYEIDEENSYNVVDDDDDEEGNIIKFQDGTKITLNREDVDTLSSRIDGDSTTDAQPNKRSRLSEQSDESDDTTLQVSKKRKIDNALEDTSKVKAMKKCSTIKNNINKDLLSHSNLNVNVLNSKKRLLNDDNCEVDSNEPSKKKAKLNESKEYLQGNIQEDFLDTLQVSKKRKIDNALEDTSKVKAMKKCSTIKNNINKDLLSHSNLNVNVLNSKKRLLNDDNCEVDSNEPSKKKAKLNESKEYLQGNIQEDIKEDARKLSNDTDIVDNTKENDACVNNCANTIKQDSVEQKKINEETFTRVNHIIRYASSGQNCVSKYHKFEETNDMQKRYTRLAFFKMREELNELTVTDNPHVHEYFVVNTFKILYMLQNIQDYKKYESFKGLMVPSDLLPLTINNVTEVINELNKYATFPKYSTSYIDLKKDMIKDTSYDLDKFDAIYKYIREKKEIGASIEELTNKFQGKESNDLYNVLSLLVENHLLLRFGVTTVRYIHHSYTNPWLIHSYKIYRLEKESLLPVPKDSVYLLKNENIQTSKGSLNLTKETEHNDSTSDLSLCENILPKENCVPCHIFEENVLVNNQPKLESKLNSDDTQNQLLENHPSDSESEHNLHVKRKMQRRKTSLLPQRDIYRAAKQLDFTTAEEIRVVMKPWIRIDGVLNRRVLDRMLGSVLTYCLTHPGVMLSKVQNRFVPALQPFHTRELIEILIKLKCLQKKVLIKSRVTLFSKPVSIKPKINAEWGTEEEIYIEPLMGAMIKFGIFLSTKAYNSDFLP